MRHSPARARRFVGLAAGVSTLILCASASAFEQPVHFSFTIWLAATAGFSEAAAYELGKFDQATDDDPTTSPMPGFARGSAVEQRRKYHAFGEPASVKVLEKEIKCGKRIPVTRSTFKRMGQFLHALEDKFSHRCCGPKLGQLTIGSGPDYPWYAPPVFVQMAEEKFEAVVKLRRQCYASPVVEQDLRSEFSRAKVALDSWARDAYDYSAEDADNDVRWDSLIRNLYGQNYAKYTDTFVRAYVVWKRAQGWRTP